MIALVALLGAATSVATPTKSLMPSRPVSILSGAITHSDYPRQALRRGAQGVSRIRLTILASGLAQDCQIALSSGDRELDEAACRITTTRTRFSPATDSQGREVARVAILPVRWLIE